MTEDEFTIKTGHLAVGDGHEIYYQQWGNKDAKPIFVINGGPIYFVKDKHKLSFDPKIHNVVFHDQRGCGQSSYVDRRKANNSDTRAKDIDSLRKHFRYDTIQLYGYSWGSTLALYYAEKYPELVTKMIIGGVFTASKGEIDVIFQSGGANGFPDAWEYYIEPIPEALRADTLSYYAHALQNGTDEQRLATFKRFTQLESSASSPDADYATFLQGVECIETLEDLDDALLSIEWFQNQCYIPENFIFDNAASLNSIPIIIVQGRSDFVCPPKTALELSKRLGPDTFLHFVQSGHSESNVLREATRAHIRHFLA